MVTGLIFSSYPLMQVLAAPFLGRLSDVWGRKPVLLLEHRGHGVRAGDARLGELALDAVREPHARRHHRRQHLRRAGLHDRHHLREGPRQGVRAHRRRLRHRLHPRPGQRRAALRRSASTLPAFVAAGLAAINLLLVLFILPESLSAERRAQVKAEPAKGWGLRELGTTLTPAARRPAAVDPHRGRLHVRGVRGRLQPLGGQRPGADGSSERPRAGLRRRPVGDHPARRSSARSPGASATRSSSWARRRWRPCR